MRLAVTSKLITFTVGFGHWIQFLSATTKDRELKSLVIFFFFHHFFVGNKLFENDGEDESKSHYYNNLLSCPTENEKKKDMGLLKGIDPILTADLLYVLRSMGHGDKLAIVDCNFPAVSTAQSTTTKKVVTLSTPSLPDVTRAVLSVMPLDFFVESPASFMTPEEGGELPQAGVEVIQQTMDIIDKSVGDGVSVSVKPLERFDFYEEGKTCFAIVQTLERRPYANIVLQKGVIGPDGNDLKP